MGLRRRCSRASGTPISDPFDAVEDLSRGVWVVSHSLRSQQLISLNLPPSLSRRRSISPWWTCCISRFDRRSRFFEFDLVKFIFLWLTFDGLKVVFTCVIHRVVWHFFFCFLIDGGLYHMWQWHFESFDRVKVKCIH